MNNKIVAIDIGNDVSVAVTMSLEEYQQYPPNTDAENFYNTCEFYQIRPNIEGLTTLLSLGDVYIFEGDEIVGVCGGLKFQQIPRRVLNVMLPSMKPSNTHQSQNIPTKHITIPEPAKTQIAQPLASKRPKMQCRQGDTRRLPLPCIGWVSSSILPLPGPASSVPQHHHAPP